MVAGSDGRRLRGQLPIGKVAFPEISTLGILGFGKYYIGYIYKYTYINTAVLKYTNSPKHKIYRFIMPEACDFFNGWWKDSSSLIVHHDSHFIYCFGWFK